MKVDIEFRDPERPDITLEDLAKFTIPSGNLRQWYFIRDTEPGEPEKGLFYNEDDVHCVYLTKEVEEETGTSLRSIK